MSEQEKKSGFCHWCDTLTNSIVKESDNGRLVWTGCPDCYIKRKELKKKHADSV